LEPVDLEDSVVEENIDNSENESGNNPDLNASGDNPDLDESHDSPKESNSPIDYILDKQNSEIPPYLDDLD
jgi:hypothetical protein